MFGTSVKQVPVITYVIVAINSRLKSLSPRLSWSTQKHSNATKLHKYISSYLLIVTRNSTQKKRKPPSNGLEKLTDLRKLWRWRLLPQALNKRTRSDRFTGSWPIRIQHSSRSVILKRFFNVHTHGLVERRAESGDSVWLLIRYIKRLFFISTGFLFIHLFISFIFFTLSARRPFWRAYQNEDSVL